MQTFDRVRWDLSSPPANLSKAITIVDKIAHDKINGASYLGRKAIEAIHTAAHLSTAQTKSDLFRDVLMIGTKMRIVQPNMASIRNISGNLLHDIDSARQTSKSVAEYRDLIEQLTKSFSKLRKRGRASVSKPKQHDNSEASYSDAQLQQHREESDSTVPE